MLLLDFSEEFLKSLRMECNKNTTPIVAFIDPESYHSFKTADIKDLIINSEEARYADGELCKLVAQIVLVKIEKAFLLNEITEHQAVEHDGRVPFAV